MHMTCELLAQPATDHLAVDLIYQHIVGLELLVHGLANPLELRKPLLYVIQVHVLLGLGYLPVLHIHTRYQRGVLLDSAIVGTGGVLAQVRR